MPNEDIDTTEFISPEGMQVETTNQLAKPILKASKEQGDVVSHEYEGGLTKHEKTCIELGVPETGDPELDKVIRKAEHRDIAKVAMQGICAKGKFPKNKEGAEYVAHHSTMIADKLLTELNK